MIKRLQLTCAFLVVLSYAAVAQTGSIKGKIYDKATKEPLPFASVVAELGGAQKGGAQSDFDGEYTIKPLAAGEYTIKISYVGYNDIVITGVLVSIDKITNQDLALSKKVVETQEVEIIAYKVPLIDKGNPSVQSTVTREEIAAAPTRDVRSVAATTAGVFQRDEGDDVNIRGTRDNATDYYIDGIRVRGSQKLPNSGIEQLTVISGGIPAQYGDNTGGVISITTRGPSQEFNGGIEYSTSELFDQYGYNLVSANLSGPIWRKKMADGSRKSMIGFFVSGEFQAEDDPDPSAVGMYKLKDDKQEEFYINPLKPKVVNGNSTPLPQAEFFTLNDLEKIKIKENTASKQFRFNGKVDVRLSDLSNLTLGGSFNSEDRNTFNIQRALYNTSENPNRIDTDYRGFVRFTQKIGNAVEGEGNKSASTIKNAFFSFQAEYQRNLTRIQDEAHKDNLWNYGYIGSFKRGVTESHTKVLLSEDTILELDGVTYSNVTYYSHNVNLSDNYSYTPGGINTNIEAYNDNAISYNQAGNTFDEINGITNIGGMRNGDAAPPVFAMWQNYANPNNNFQDSDDDVYRFSVSGNADIKNHAISIGIEYEQLIDRNYQLLPRGLWTLARIKANEKLSNNKTDEYVVSYVDDTLITDFQYAYTPNEFTEFYENIRSALGKSNLDFINVDELSPDDMKVNFFTPDEINTSGINGIINGYDYSGERLTGNPSFNDFFNKKKNGAFAREVGAFKPIYIAGYIQDHFNIENLDFNIGVRVDRFDANQSVLKDPYLLYAARTAGELSIPNRPSNIGDDYVVYVEDIGNPDVNEIVGYRDGETWYDTRGNLVSNPADLFTQSGGNAFPYLVNSEETNKQAIKKEWDPSGSFEDYEPQVTIMPRIAFSFSITDQALFFAHYDVLTQRPPDRLFNNPWDWISLSDGSAITINNPNLKPERKTEYEIGFRQVVSKSSALSISAFYHELKDQIQLSKLYGVYPVDYTTYRNQDFGNVKGLSLAYDLRRTGNVRLTAKYDLQFADGTGSGDRGSLDLINTDQPNLKVISPLDFDQRHSFSATIDYRYESGSEYDGPMLFGKPILQNTGMNLVMKAGSGTPYTKSTSVYPEGDDLGLQGAGQRTVDGNINSSRLPWSYRFDIKIDRDFEVKFGQKGDKKKTAIVNVYFLVQNLFDTRNIISVYRYTGNPSDDGFLNSAQGVDKIKSYDGRETSYADQYGIRLANPNNYSLPRRARLGVSLNF